MLDGGCFSGPISAAAIGTALSTTLKISSITYELKAVSENAKDLLDSTKHVSDNLQTAKNLRRQKSIHFDSNEKKWIDGVLASTEKTLSNVAALIEPARVDMQTNFGSVGLLNRGLFVFRDSPKVQTHLARLAIASGSLDTVLNILCTREGRSTFSSSRPESSTWGSIAMLKRKSCASLRSEASAPPSYQEPVPRLESLDTIRYNRSRFLGREPRTWTVADPPVKISEDPVDNTTWSRAPTISSMESLTELEGISSAESRSHWYNKEVISQVEELLELECQPVTSQESTDSSIRSASISTVNTTSSSPPDLYARWSARSPTSDVSTHILNAGQCSATMGPSTRPTGRQRGRAWMEHQANK